MPRCSASRPHRAVRAAVAAGLVALTLAVAASAEEGAEELETAQRCLARIAGGELEQARGCFAIDALTGPNLDLLERAHAALQLGGEVQLDYISPRVVILSGDERIEQYVFHARGSERAALCTVSLRPSPTGPELIGLSWGDAPFDLGDMHPFTLVGMPWYAYLMLLAAIAVPLYMLHTAWLCYRRQPAFLWLWVAFVLIGVGRLSLVWRPDLPASQALGFTPLAAALLGVTVGKWPLYNPWLLTVSFPLGAVIFRWWTRRWDEPYVDPDATPSATAPSGDGG